MASRGKLTEKIKSNSLKLLGREITQGELRLMPYIQYCLMNSQVFEPKRLSCEEREIISQWRKEGYLEGGVSGFAVKKDFWDAMNQILWLGYVAYEDECCTDKVG